MSDKKEAGRNKESFSIFFHGGSIWCEHLDSLEDDRETVISKFKRDMTEIRKPSTSAFIAVNLDETEVEDDMLNEIVDSFIALEGKIRKVVFVGLKRPWKRYVRRKNLDTSIVMECLDDFEKAKEWLI